MTSTERTAFAAEFDLLHTEIALLRGDVTGVKSDMSDVKNELAEWRGGMRLFRAAASFVGLGGLALILAAFVNSVPR